ncbi:MAG: LEA type 2 family protein [Phycisphaerae bacterium]|jgi:LEA14-like dessication related protein|nr:LEA type 2 family protein [Phycisphaerae bacterium]
MPGMNEIRSLSFRTGVLSAAAIVLCAFNITGCIIPPKVSLSDIEISSMSFTKLNLVCMFDVRNPNLFAANLKKFDCDFRAFDRSIASGDAETPIPTIPAGGRRTVPVDLVIRLPELASVARQYAKGKTVPYQLTSRPVFNVLGASFPVSFRHNGKVPSALAPKWKLAGISRRYGPEPAFLVTFEIRNPSGIHMSLAGVKGALRLGGEDLLQLQETMLTELPDGETIELVVPVRVRLTALAGAARKLLTDWRSLKFDGEFHLKTPLSLRKMLMGKPLGKKP